MVKSSFSDYTNITAYLKTFFLLVHLICDCARLFEALLPLSKIEINLLTTVICVTVF